MLQQLKYKSITALVYLCSTVVLLVACDKPIPALKVQPGEGVVDLNVQDLYGKDAVLKTSTGKVLIVNFWATWCGPCRHEMPSLDRLRKKLDKDKFNVVGISVDDDDHVVREFLIERKVEFTNFMDPAMTVANDHLGIRAFPSTFILGPDGKLLKVIEGWREWDAVHMVEDIKGLAD